MDQLKLKIQLKNQFRRPDPINCAPYGTRTHVTAVRGRRPRPLDEGSFRAWYYSQFFSFGKDYLSRLVSIGRSVRLSSPG